MNSTFDAVLRSWPWDPWLVAGLTLSAVLYLRGWRGLQRRDPHRWTFRQPLAFSAGLGVLFLALASPLEPFAYFFLQVHMMQHLLLTMAAPPLLWLGTPMFPLLCGLPEPIRTYWMAPLLRTRFLRNGFARMTHPWSALMLFAAVNIFWHLPGPYDLALRSPGWHYLQHLCFLGAGLVFWYPVVRPYPSRPRWSVWLLIPFLLVADVQNTILSAFLTFSNRVLYSHYALTPRLGNLSALEDQAAAGVIMWVPGSLAFLVPVCAIVLRLLIRPEAPARKPAPRRIALTVVPSQSADLLRAPLLGRFLRWRHARLCLQIPLLILAMLVMLDGFLGPQVSPMNLAGVLPWIHWRGLLILGLLALGNIFCLACPFLVPRTLARRWLPAGRRWPGWLRNKWPAVLLLLAFLWAYEALALWDSPWMTAWIVLAYFVAAFTIDALFAGASFCKYVCPIGQFNFVQSLVSPLEVKVRDPAVCLACRTKDCIRGRENIPGCELNLYQPRKSSNMDCTFCLDCIHACPHDNIGIQVNLPGREILHDPHRSGVGRFSQRRDLMALAVILVFGAFANAALMTGPVLDWHIPTTGLFFLLVIVGPILLLTLATCLSQAWGRSNLNRMEIAGRFIFTLIPLGFGMWLTHYSFHFFTSYTTAQPAAQRFAADWGWTGLGAPLWSYSCCVPTVDWLLRLEIVFLDLGLLLSLYLGYRLARSQTSHLGLALKAFTPWAVLMLALFAAGVWIVFQPMDMRGTMALVR